MTPPEPTTPRNRLADLQAAGQSIWYDNIHREVIESGELARLIASGVSGLTSNPTIFEKAITGSAAYDSDLRALADRPPVLIFEAIAGSDVRRAADRLRPIYDATEGRDGFVSLEVAPALAHDTEGTVAEARRIWSLVDRPNLMVKVPATPAGMPALTRLIGEGINVNVTLIFALAAYEQVMAAYLDGLERLAAAGHALDRVASVASFFVSRVDTAVDRELTKQIEATSDPAERERLGRLIGQAGIANAVGAYTRFQRVFTSERFDALAVLGARVQRPLWASTSTKNPAFPDLYYVDALAGADTINTLPPATLEAATERARVAPRLADAAWAEGVLGDLAALGIDLDRITADLLEEGIGLFARSYDGVLDGIAGKAAALGRGPGHLPAGDWRTTVESAVEDLTADRVVERIWSRDPTVWTADPAHHAEIRERLGWLDVGTTMREHLGALTELAQAARAAGSRDVVLCGMGGSSLCPEVLRLVFGRAPAAPRLHVLDSTDPATVAEVADRIDPAHSLFLIASKSGGTIEVDSLNRFFWDRVSAAKPDRPGDQFVAITDPDTSLDRLGQARGYRRIFRNPPDIGGRYSALSLFGLVPAALIGIDPATLLERGEAIARRCRPEVAPEANPGLTLGATIGALARAGRDKLTIVTSPRLAGFGLWVEQLIAESTGKAGRGIVPVAGEPPGAAVDYGADRCFVYVRLVGDDNAETDRLAADLDAAGQPIIRLDLADPFDLGGEFFRWEFATAVAGAILGVDVFDQPNVQESKDITGQMLAAFESASRLPADPPLWSAGGLAGWGLPAADLDGAVAALLEAVRPGDYVGILAYLTPTAAIEATLAGLRQRLRARPPHPATTLGHGPRFLHSTGQLHKGGPNTGVFLQLTADAPLPLPVPGRPYDFGTLRAAQAEGDFQALRRHGRRALRIHLGASAEAGLARLIEAVDRLSRR